MNTNSRSSRDAYFAAVDALGDAWIFLILREAFFGATRFQDYLVALNISRARLSERLSHLVELGILKKIPYIQTPIRYEYQLTKRGRATYPIALSMIAWAETWRPQSQQLQLTHADCGARLHPKIVCKTCQQQIKPDDVDWESYSSNSTPISKKANVRGWRKRASFDGLSSRKDPAVEMLKAVGDRWSMLIVYGAIRKNIRFREVQKLLGMADTILSSRLKHLAREGVLERVDGQRTSPYRVTPLGADLIGSVLAMRTWAINWLPQNDKLWAGATHKCCGTDVEVMCICTHCGEEVSPGTVTF